MRARECSWFAVGLLAVGCARPVEPVSPPPPREPLPSDPTAETVVPPASTDSVDPEALELAWRQADDVFDHLLVWSRRHPVLTELDQSAVEAPHPRVRRLSFQRGVSGFVTDPACASGQSKCRSVPTWAGDSGVYLDVRVHQGVHAAGAFDVVAELGPLTLEAVILASDERLRHSLLRELRVLVGVPEPTRSGCTEPFEQAVDWIRQEQRRRGVQDVEKIQVERRDFDPLRPSVDLDGDGIPELVISHLDIGSNAEHFFFAERDGCTRLVGVVDFAAMFGVSCEPRPAQALCELHVAQLMIHGESQASTWRFDGELYREVSR